LRISQALQRSNKGLKEKEIWFIEETTDEEDPTKYEESEMSDWELNHSDPEEQQRDFHTKNYLKQKAKKEKEEQEKGMKEKEKKEKELRQVELLL